MIKIVKNKKISLYGHNGGPRWFGLGLLDKKIIKFTPFANCREEFHYSFLDITNKVANTEYDDFCSEIEIKLRNASQKGRKIFVVYEVKNVDEAKNIARFVKKAEKIIFNNKNCKNYKKSQFVIYGLKIAINCSEFWVNAFRFGFLTILLRTGRKFTNKIDFKECLFASEYLHGEDIKETEVLIAVAKAFLKGKVTCKNNDDGFWRDFFCDFDKSKALKLLT